MSLFAGRMINQRERFVLPIYDKAIILIVFVEKVTPFSVSSRLTYGTIDDNSDVVCKAKDFKKLKIETNRMEEK